MGRYWFFERFYVIHWNWRCNGDDLRIIFSSWGLWKLLFMLWEPFEPLSDMICHMSLRIILILRKTQWQWLIFFICSYKNEAIFPWLAWAVASITFKNRRYDDLLNDIFNRFVSVSYSKKKKKKFRSWVFSWYF